MSRLTHNGTLLLLILFIGWIHPIHAEDNLPFDYDIFARDKQAVVWVDLSPYLSTGEIEHLQDGIDIAFECGLTLLRSRRFFGNQKVTRRTLTLRIRYRPVTEDFLMLSSDTGWTRNDPFVSLIKLQRFLRDSIEIPLIPRDSLENDQHYTLKVRITSIALTAFSLAPPSEKSDEPADSPLRYLFRQFLSLTGYGYREYTTKSRPFSPLEIVERPKPS